MDTRAVLSAGALQTVAVLVALQVAAPDVVTIAALGLGGVVVAVLTTAYHREIVEGVATGVVTGVVLLGVAALAPSLLSPAGAGGCTSATDAASHPIAVLGGCWPAWLFLSLLGSAGIPVLGALNATTAMVAAPYSDRVRAVLPGWS